MRKNTIDCVVRCHNRLHPWLEKTKAGIVCVRIFTAGKIRNMHSQSFSDIFYRRSIKHPINNHKYSVAREQAMLTEFPQIINLSIVFLWTNSKYEVAVAFQQGPRIRRLSVSFFNLHDFGIHKLTWRVFTSRILITIWSNAAKPCIVKVDAKWYWLATMLLSPTWVSREILTDT